MRQLRHMLQLARDGASTREIARVLGVARGTVQKNLKHAEDAGLGGPGGRAEEARRDHDAAVGGVLQLFAGGSRRHPDSSAGHSSAPLAKLFHPT